jgi:hypothetical protein
MQFKKARIKIQNEKRGEKRLGYEIATAICIGISGVHEMTSLSTG